MSSQVLKSLWYRLIFLNNKNKKQRRRNPQPKGSKKRKSPRSDLIETTRFKSNIGSNVIRLDRTTVIPAFTLTPNSGINGGFFYDMELSFSLQQTLVYINGNLVTTVANPGFSEIVNLFQEYRIDEVEVMFLYNNNTSQVSNTTNLPILQVAVDYTGTASINQAAILQFENLRVIQMGNYRGEGGPSFRFKPRPFINGATSFFGAPDQWISVLVPTIPYNSLKMVYDPVSTASTISVGNIELYVRYHISARKTN